MTFLSPYNLWLLAAIPVLWVVHAKVCGGRRRSLATQYPGLFEKQEGRGSTLLPALLFAVALASALTATARPAVILDLAAQVRTVILAIDISGSMQAEDVEPTRLGAAQAAALEFIRALPDGVRVGLVAFTDTAQIVHEASEDHEAVGAVVKMLTPQQGTAIGSAILASLQALLPREMRIDLDSASAGSSMPVTFEAPAGRVDASSAVILLTDGQNTDGPSPTVAALAAAQQGARVYTVGIGTPDGTIHRGLAMAVPVGVDEGTLRQIAALTKAEYFYATTAPDLRGIYSSLSAKLVPERKPVELTALFCAAAAAALAAAALLSLLWFGRLA